MKSSSDYFLRITDKAFWRGGLKGYVKNFDDLLLFANTMKELVEILQNLLKICREKHITLQPKKIGISTPETGLAKYAGLSVSHLGIATHEEKLEAITKMEAPKDISEVRSYLGMVNQMRSFFPT